jgi:RNA polymerase sigma factor (sigma-70 family)
MIQISILGVVRRCQRDPGDREAFDLFYRTLFPYVRLYTRAFRLQTAPLTEEDVIQEIFLKLMEHFPETSFENENQFLAYVKAISENYIIDMVRKYEKHTFEELTRATELTSRDQSPEEAIVQKEQQEILLRLIGKLTGTCQNLLREFLLEGRSLAEIARRQTVPLGTVYPRFSRCVAELRRRVELGKDAPPKLL